MSITATGNNPVLITVGTTATADARTDNVATPVTANTRAWRYSDSISATILAAASVTDFGLEFETQGGGALAVTHNATASVTQTQLPTNTTRTDALSLIGSGGAITYTGSGTVSSTVSSGVVLIQTQPGAGNLLANVNNNISTSANGSVGALIVDQFAVGGTGNVTVNVAGGVTIGQTGNADTYGGIFAKARGTGGGNATVTLGNTAGTTTVNANGTAIAGVQADSLAGTASVLNGAGTSAITVTGTGSNSGIFAASGHDAAGTNTVVVSTGASSTISVTGGGDNSGIFVRNYTDDPNTGNDVVSTGDISITTGSGSSIAVGSSGTSNNEGIGAYTNATTGTATDITINASGTISATGNEVAGINARQQAATGTGDVSVTTTGGHTINITDTTATGASYGIRATNAGSGTVTVTSAGTINAAGTGAADIVGINAAGNAGVTVNMTGGHIGTAVNRVGVGIDAIANGATGDVNVTAQTIFTSGDAVRADGSAAGNLSVTVSGALDSSTGVGVHLIGGTTNTIDANANITGNTGIQVAGGTTTLTNSAGSTTITGTTAALDIDSGTLVIGAGNISLSGNVIDDDVLRINRTDVFTIGGVISGTGAVQQNGAGTTVLTGTNTYSGATTVSAGTLRVDGSITSTTTVQNGGTLAGTGSVGDVTVQSGGHVAPGASPGILTTGDFTLNAGGTLDIEIGGTTAGTQYDQLDVNGTVSLAGTLNASFINAFSPAHLDAFIIIDNDGVDAVTGNFAGLPEGTQFTVGGRELVITYQFAGPGGDGNDVALIVNAAPQNTVPGTQTVNEDAVLSFPGNISVADADGAPDEPITVTLGVGQGTLTLATTAGLSFGAGDGTADATMTFSGTIANINTALNGLTYQGNLNFNGADTLTITSNDNNGLANSIDTDSITLNVSAVNDAPTVVNGNTETLAAINEDNANPPGTLISAEFGPHFSDAEDTVAGGSTANNFAGIAISANAATAGQGTWQWSTDGTTWNNIATTVSDTNALVLAATTQIRFLPALNFNGTAPALTSHLIDDSAGAVTNNSTVNLNTTGTGDPTQYSTGTVALSETINAVNDAPVNTVPGAQTAQEDTDHAITGVSVSDVDAGAQNIQVTLHVDHGILNVRTNDLGLTTGLNAWQVSGDTTDTVVLTGTQAQINASLGSADGLFYRGDLNFDGADTLTITTNDLGHTGTDPGLTDGANAEQDVDTVAITVNNVTADTLSAFQTSALKPSSDADTDGQIDPGETVTITVNIANNSANTAANNVIFDEGVGAALNGLTQVAGTVHITPIAFDDSYAGVAGNSPIVLNVLSNDIDPNASTPLSNVGATIASVDTTGTNGTVTINPGSTSITFTPNTGFNGITTFKYFITDAEGLTSNEAATVTVNVNGGKIWYVDANASAVGQDGSFDHPFTSLTQLNGVTGDGTTNDDVDGTGDTIFVYSQSGGPLSYSGGIVLESGQKLIGDRVAFSVNGSVAGATATSIGHAADDAAHNPVISTSVAGANVITLADNNTVRGLDLGNAGTGGSSLAGTNFGTLTVDHVAINTNTQAINLNTGAFGGGASFTSINVSTPGITDVSLTNVTGSVDLGTGSMAGSFVVAGGSVSTTYSGNLSQTANAAMVSVTGGHTGTLTFQTGTLNATNGTGLQFDNADGSYNFNGTTTLNGGNAGVDIVNGSGGSFTFGSGTAITSPTGTAFDFQNSNANVTYSGNITQIVNNAALVNVLNQSGGTLTFQTGTLNATTGTGLQFNNADGTSNFNGTTTLNGGDAGVDIVNGSGGTFGFGSNTSITSPTGAAFDVQGSTANVTYSGAITQATAGQAMVNVLNETGGTITFQTGTLNATNGTGLQFTNADGTVNFNGTTTLNGGDAGIDILAGGDAAAGSTGTFSFGSNATLTHNAAGTAFNLAGSDANVTFSGSITDNNGFAVDINDHDAGTVTFQTGTISAVGANAQGLRVANSNGGTVNFNSISTTLTTQANKAVTLDTANTGGTINFNHGATGNGLDINTTTATGFSALGGGTITVQGAGNTINADNTITHTGTAIEIVGATIGAGGIDFDTTTTGGGTNGIHLQGVTGGAIDLGGGSISGTTGPAFLVGDGGPTANAGGTSAITYNGTITTTGTARAVDIQDRAAGAGNINLGGTITHSSGDANVIRLDQNAAGTITFSGANSVLNGGTQNAVHLTNNTNTTINFTGGGLDIDTTGGMGFNATGGGTVNVTGTNNSINSVSNTALNVANTTIGASGLTFQRIDAGNNTAAADPASGIVLNNTGASGGLTVTGDGTAANNGSGGVIQNTTGDGINLTSTMDVHLAQMNIQNNLGDGIGGSTINGLVLNRLNISANGNDPATDESGINIAELTGTGAAGAHPTAITNSSITNNQEFEIQITNTTGTLTNLQLTNNTISSTGAGANGGVATIANLVNFPALGTATMGITATGGTYTGNASNNGATATALNIDSSGTSSTVTATVNGGTFTNNNVAVTVSSAQGGNLDFDITGTTSTQNRSHGLNLFVAASSTGTVTGTFTNNTIGTLGTTGSGSDLGFGIRVQNEGSTNTANPVTVLISGNTVRELANFAAINVNQGIAAQSFTRTTNVTITNNIISDVDNSRGIIIQQNNTTAPGTTNASISGNDLADNIAGNVGDGTVIRLRQLSGGTFNLTQTAPTAANNANELDNANTVGAHVTTPAEISISGTITFGQPLPPQPLLAQAGGVDAAPADVPQWQVVSSGDFNGDGINDVLSLRNDGLIRVDMHNAGGEVANWYILGQIEAGWHIVGIGDVDGDGTTDILLQHDNGAYQAALIHNNTVAATLDLELVDGVLRPVSHSAPATPPADAGSTPPAASGSTPPSEPAPAPDAGGNTADNAGGTTGGTPPAEPAVHPAGTVETHLTQAELNAAVNAAIARWEATGLTAEQSAYLHTVTFTVDDMAGLYLGTANPGHVAIDSDGAGYGWYVDATPADDVEFANGSGTRLQTDPSQLPAGHLDLLTTVMHEMGHQLGLTDSYALGDRDSLMYGYLVTGERRLPGEHQADGAVLGSVAHEEFLLSPIQIGTLPAGRTVTITFDATVNPQNNQFIANPTNDGVVTSSFPTVNTNVNVTTLDTLSLGNLIFNDINGDGNFDPLDPSFPEAGIEGVHLTLFADTNNSGGLDGGVAVLGTAITDVNGIYSFFGLAPGKYIVGVDQSNFNAGGALFTFPNSSPGNPDPDDNVDNDDNSGALSVAGMGAASLAIELAYNTEPTAGTGNDTNNTLDMGFFSTPPNAAPTITAGDTAAYTEQQTVPTDRVQLDPTITITDDGATLDSATVTISSGFFAGDQLFFTAASGSGITGGYNPLTGVLSLSGTASLADYELTLESVTYLSTSDNPTNFGANTTRTITWTVNDGTQDSTVPGTSSINITAVNDPPALNNVDPDALYLVGGPLVTLSASTTVIDPDDQNLDTATVTITDFFTGDELSVNGAITGTFNGISWSYNGAGVLSFTTAGALADYQTLLQQVQYRSTDAHPSDGHAPGADQSRTVEWFVNDGDVNSLTATTTVTVDFAPLVDLDAGDGTPPNDFTTAFQEEVAVVLGSGPVPIGALGGVTIADDDNATLDHVTIDLTNPQTGDVLSYTGSVPGITLDPSSTAIHIVLTGAASKADYAAAIESITFDNTTENPDTTDRIITTVANDGITDGNTATTTVQVTAVNDAPVNTVPGPQTTDEDTALAITGLQVNDVDIIQPGDVITVTLHVDHGTIHVLDNVPGGLDPLDITGNDTDTVTLECDPALVNTTLAAVGGVVYQPNANFHGSDTLTVTTNDNGFNGTDPDTLPGGPTGDPTSEQDVDTVAITVNSVNDAPAGADNTKTIAEDQTHVFATLDFGFTDPNDSPANALAAVKITSLPTAGTLTNNGAAVNAGDFVSATDIAANHLVFTPDANQFGTPYSSFTFQVQDNGGTLNSGVDLDQTPNTFTVDVTSVNDEPAGPNITKNIQEDAPYTFAAADFGFTDANDAAGSGGANALQAVKITTLPTGGTLTLSGSPVAAGDSIQVGDIPNLVFTPTTNLNGVGAASFTFQVQDDGGTLNGGVNLDQTPNTFTFDIAAVNDAPVLDPAASPALNAENEDAGAPLPVGPVGTLVASLVDLAGGGGVDNVSDVDAGALTGIALTGTNTANGTWFYSLDDGDNWSPVGAVSDASALLLAADTETRLFFRPNADFNGTVSSAITFRAWDQTTGANGQGSVDTSGANNGGTTAFSTLTDTAAITVNPVADVVNDSLTTNEDVGITANVLTGTNGASADNFEDPGRAITSVSQGTHGSVGFAANGDVTYTPLADFNGSDSFTYTVTAGGVTETATVNVTVNAVSDIQIDGLQTPEDTAFNVDVLANDTFENPLRALTSFTDGTHGTVTRDTHGSPGEQNDDTLIYTPNADFNGNDTFTYTVTSNGVTETTTVFVVVDPVDDAVDDTLSTVEDHQSTINVLANDNFEDAGRVVTAVTQGAHGTVTFQANGNVTYNPAPNFRGDDSFTYTVTAGGSTETATVNVSVVLPAPPPPGTAPVDGDFNGDHLGDLFVFRPDTGQNAIWQMNNNVRLDSGTDLPNNGTTWHVKALADLDATGGQSDFVWQNDNGAVATWQMNGVTIIGQANLPNPGAATHVVDAKDFDANGGADILLQNDNGQLSIWFMQNATTIGSQVTIDQNPGAVWHAIAGDFNGDGQAGLLFTTAFGNTAIWEDIVNTAPGQAHFDQQANLQNNGPTWHAKATGDFDGDNKDDIVWQNDNGAVAVWLMDGLNIKAGYDIVGSAANGPTWHLVEARDMNLDGRDDIVWQNDNGAVALWQDFTPQGDSIASFTTQQNIVPELNPTGSPFWHVL